MDEIIHVVMRVKDQETYFNGAPYPHYRIGWKQGDTFHVWNGHKCTEKDIEEWKELK